MSPALRPLFLRSVETNAMHTSRICTVAGHPTGPCTASEPRNVRAGATAAPLLRSRACLATAEEAARGIRMSSHQGGNSLDARPPHAAVKKRRMAGAAPDDAGLPAARLQSCAEVSDEKVQLATASVLLQAGSADVAAPDVAGDIALLHVGVFAQWQLAGASVSPASSQRGSREGARETDVRQLHRITPGVEAAMYAAHALHRLTVLQDCSWRAIGEQSGGGGADGPQRLPIHCNVAQRGLVICTDNGPVTVFCGHEEWLPSRY